MQDSSTHWRSLVAEALELLQSRDQQLQYEHAVPNVDVTSELISIWFDQVYHPEYVPFSSEFTAAELDSLSRFNQVFDQAIDLLPVSDGTVQTWHDTAVWQGVMQAAQHTRQKIDGANSRDFTVANVGPEGRVNARGPDSDA